MTEAEAWAFLTSAARPGVLSTVRANGRPHTAPVWFDVDGESLAFNTGVTTVKGRNLARDPRVSVCVQDDRPPYAYVVVEGVAEISDDLELVRTWAARLGGRYMGADRAEEYGRRNGVPGELLIRVIPRRISGSKDLAD